MLFRSLGNVEIRVDGGAVDAVLGPLFADKGIAWRRSKEIAIRKVNGAEASSILRLFSKDIFWISLPAVFLGGLGAWYIGGVWIEQFVEGVDFGICGFLLIACIVLLLIIGCVVFKAWRIANENPVDSIKSE